MSKVTHEKGSVAGKPVLYQKAVIGKCLCMLVIADNEPALIFVQGGIPLPNHAPCFMMAYALPSLDGAHTDFLVAARAAAACQYYYFQRDNVPFLEMDLQRVVAICEKQIAELLVKHPSNVRPEHGCTLFTTFEEQHRLFNAVLFSNWAQTTQPLEMADAMSVEKIVQGIRDVCAPQRKGQAIAPERNHAVYDFFNAKKKKYLYGRYTYQTCFNEQATELQAYGISSVAALKKAVAAGRMVETRTEKVPQPRPVRKNASKFR